MMDGIEEIMVSVPILVATETLTAPVELVRLLVGGESVKD